MNVLERKNKLLLCLTPVHIGDGGMQIGAVDNLIMKDIASQEPDFPGTTILGNYSHFVYLWGKSHCEEFVEVRYNYGTKDNKIDMTKYQLLFGLDRIHEEMPPEQIHEKTVRFGAARILWIPCMTLKGPKLISTKERFCNVFGNIGIPEFSEDELLTQKGNLFNDKEIKKQDNDLYWLNLKNLKITSQAELWNNELDQEIESSLPDYLQGKKIAENLVFVSEDIFPYIVSKSLEIRTSVSIDIVTHAGKDGALFTYELVPRGTLLSFPITISKIVAEKYTGNSIVPEKGIEGVWKILDMVNPYFEMVGIGGMTSRGFGKCKILDLKQ